MPTENSVQTSMTKPPDPAEYSLKTTRREDWVKTVRFGHTFCIKFGQFFRNVVYVVREFIVVVHPARMRKLTQVVPKTLSIQ